MPQSRGPLVFTLVLTIKTFAVKGRKSINSLQSPE